MKRLLSALLAVSLLFSLCACGGNIPNNTPSSNSGLTEPDIPDTPPPDTDTPDQPSGDENTTPPTDDTQTPPVEDNPVVDPGQDDNTQSPDDTGNTDEPVEYIRTIDPYAPMVALTFDDGPHERYTAQILDVLEQYNAVATFFEVGYNAKLYPELLLRTVELGCELASHTYAHHDLTTLSKDAMLTDLAKLDKIIYDATGTMPTLVRPPYGAANSMVKYESGRAMILWTVDPQDWKYRDAQVLIDYFKNYGNLDGEIVLMHSIHGSTAEAMATVVPWLIEQGYQLVTVSELMAYYYGELLEANKYYNQTYFARHDRTDTPLELPDEPMKTEIPPYNTVPVVPTPKPDDTPSDTPENPSDNTTEQQPEGEDPTNNETPPEQTETPPEQGETPPEQTDTPPEQGETPPEQTETPPEQGETPPEDEEPILPPDEGILPPDEESGNENQDDSDTASGDTESDNQQ